MKVVIFLVGLIGQLHINGTTAPGPGAAALVKENMHKARIIVPTGAVHPSAHQFTQVYSGGGIDIYALAGDIVISGINAGDVTWTPTFTSEVQSLRRVTGLPNGSLHPNVRSKTWAYIDLPEGTLDVDAYYEHDYFLDGDDMLCVPSRIKFTGTATGTTIKFINNMGKDLEIDAGAEMTIVNLPRIGSRGHYKYFAELMNGGNQNNVLKWSDPAAGTEKTCPKPHFDPGTLPYRADSADCTNTHFP